MSRTVETHDHVATNCDKMWVHWKPPRGGKEKARVDGALSFFLKLKLKLPVSGLQSQASRLKAKDWKPILKVMSSRP